MAPTFTKRVLDSPIWSALDASRPKLSRRDMDSGASPAVFAIPLLIIVFLVIVTCIQRARQLERARQILNTDIPVSLPRELGVPRRNQRARVPEPAPEDVIDPPPPYVPLQTLEPAHKPAGRDALERPADSERNVRNQGQVRSILDV